MNIKKQIRKIGKPITLDYNSTEKKFSATSEEITCSSYSIKRALRELKKLTKTKTIIDQDSGIVSIKESKTKSDKVSS